MLSLRDLSIGFRRYSGFLRQEVTPRLTDLSIDLAPGEVLAVIGASGAGKSLLAHALLGVLPPNAVLSGEVRFRGQLLDPGSGPSEAGKKIALIPQQISHLDPLATVAQQIRWAARRAGLARGEVDVAAALALCQLGPEAGRLYPASLSGGMARRVLLALAMVAKPELLIADEPTVGLDPANRTAVLQMLRAKASGGGGVLLITHDLAAALPVADRVVILHEGRICGVEKAALFRDSGADLRSPQARRLWQALPENGLNFDA